MKVVKLCFFLIHFFAIYSYSAEQNLIINVDNRLTVSLNGKCERVGSDTVVVGDADLAAHPAQSGDDLPDARGAPAADCHQHFLPGDLQIYARKSFWIHTRNWRQLSWIYPAAVHCQFFTLRRWNCRPKSGQGYRARLLQ